MLLSSCVPGRLAMVASLLRAMMCFVKTRVYLFLSYFSETVYFPLADVRSWKPVMARSISGLEMQLMRVANVGRGGACGRRWLLSLRSSKNMLFPFKAKWSLLAWMQAS